MMHRRLKPSRLRLGRHGVAKAHVADQRLQCETSHKPPLLNAVHDRAAPSNVYWPPDEWRKRGMSRHRGSMRSTTDGSSTAAVMRRFGERLLLAPKRPSIERGDRRLAGVKLALSSGCRTAAVDPERNLGRPSRSAKTYTSHCSRVTAALAAWFLHDQDPIRTSASLTVDRGSMSHEAACEGSVN
jgi:hypothetical protein